MSPTVSVVVPTYNYAHFLTSAIESVFRQTLPPAEIIVVDDGSEDDTAAVARNLGPRVRYLRQPHRGLPAARNAGIRASSGDCVAFLDADDLWMPEKLALQVSLLANDARLGAVYSDAVIFDNETGEPLCTHRDYSPHPTGWILGELLQGNVIPSPTPVVRRALFETIGVFDETLKACEDWDMWIRIANASRIACIDRPLAMYRLHQGNMSRDIDTLLAFQLVVLAKAFRDPSLPEPLRKLRCLRFGQRHVAIGLYRFTVEEYRLARRDLLRAIRWCPRLLLSRRVAPTLLSCLFGPRLAGRVRAFKRRASAAFG